MRIVGRNLAAIFALTGTHSGPKRFGQRQTFDAFTAGQTLPDHRMDKASVPGCAVERNATGRVDELSLSIGRVYDMKFARVGG